MIIYIVICKKKYVDDDMVINFFIKKCFEKNENINNIT